MARVKRLSAILLCFALIIGSTPLNIQAEKLQESKTKETETRSTAETTVNVGNNSTGEVPSESENSELEQETFEINSEEDWMEFANNCRLDGWSVNRKVLLNKDINLSSAICKDFKGVSSFSGTFEGNNHSISGVVLSDGTEAIALFRYLEQEGVIRQLKVHGTISSEDGEDRIGGIVGVNAGTLRNCEFYGTVSGKGTTGGVVGYNGATGNVVGCVSKGYVSSSHSVGGIVGENRGVIADCENQANVNSDISWFEGEDSGDSSANISLSGMLQVGNDAIQNGTDIGGISGWSSGIIAGCENLATVGYLHTGRNVGGIAGRHSGSIIHCNNKGNVYGKQDVGGIVGQFEPSVISEDSERIEEEVNLLHDNISQMIDDMEAMGDVLHGDLTQLTDQTKTTVDTADAVTKELRDVIRKNVDVINDLSGRVGYVGDHLPGVMDYVDQSLDYMKKLNNDLKKVKDDLNISDKMENGTYDEAKSRRLSLVSNAGGRVSSNISNPAEGAEVTISITEEKGYTLQSLQYIPYGKAAVDVTGNVSDHKYTYTMPTENVTIKAIFAYKGQYIAETNEGGKLSLSESDDKIKLTIRENAGYELSSVAIGQNNISLSSLSVDGSTRTYETDKVDSGAPILVKAQFTKSVTTYDVEIDTSTGGTVTADPASANAGENVTLKVNAQSGYKLTAGGIQAIDGAGQTVTVTQSGENDYTFVMPTSKVKVTAQFQYVPNADTKVYTESSVGGTVVAVKNPTNNNYVITMIPASGYEVKSTGEALIISDNGTYGAGNEKNLTAADLEKNGDRYSYTLNETNYTAPIKVYGQFVLKSGVQYNVKTTAGTGGTAVADATKVAAGDTIKIAVTNEAHYRLAKLMLNGTDMTTTVKDQSLEYVVPASQAGDVEITADFDPVMVVITSETAGGSASYTVLGQEVTLSVQADAGYEVQEPLNLTDADGTAILCQKQNANAYVYKFEVSPGIKNLEPAKLVLSFNSLNDKQTVEAAKDRIGENGDVVADSMTNVSDISKNIEELLTDDFGNPRKLEDLSNSELEELEGYLLDLTKELEDASVASAEVIRDINTIKNSLEPYVNDSLEALDKDLDTAGDDFSGMIDAFQGASTEARSIIDYLNALGDLKFVNFSSDFDQNSDRLTAELKDIVDILGRLNDDTDLYSGKLEDDMKLVNDQLNKVFNLLVDRMDNLENLVNGEDIIVDCSDEDIESSEEEFARVTNCKNVGKVNGDNNIGGIAGYMGTKVAENNNSLESNRITLGSKYMARAILSDCQNEGFVKVKTENGGGIAGCMDLGVVQDSICTSSVTGNDGTNILGGIAGYSNGVVRGCSSKAELAGGSYIGGIVGKGHSVTDCLSMAYVTDYTGCVGAIAGAYLPGEDETEDITLYRRSLKDHYGSNYYVSSKLYGIDDVSYVSVAQPVTYTELMAMENVPKEFQRMQITFVDENEETVKILNLPYGSLLNTIMFPEIKAEDGDYFEWEGIDDTIIENNLVVRAVSTANVTVLQSEEKVAGKPMVLAEGVFTEAAKVLVKDSNNVPPAGLPENSTIFIKNLQFINTNLDQNATTRVRIYCAESDKTVAYVLREGNWKKVDNQMVGKYIEIEMKGVNETVCLVSEKQQLPIVYIVVGVVAAVLLVVILLVLIRKKRKVQRAKGLRSDDSGIEFIEDIDELIEKEHKKDKK